MLPVFPNKRPADSENDTIKNQHQEDFKFPMRRIPQQRPERFMRYHICRSISGV
jgi:hypothetical protein